ncbi:type II secretion system F family protein [Candidatus Woesearchaeota archaeon]|nr:type II secretion system F family protein [Candidatus Woesearchaeota archaeon]
MAKTLRVVGKAIIPKGIREKMYKYYAKLGKEEPPYERFGAYFYISTIITLIIYLLLIYPSVRTNSVRLLIGTISGWIITHLLLIFLLGLGEYVITDFKIYNRIKTIERYLPDYLELVAANLKGGMTLEQAMWNSIRPEFKVLGEEMGIVAKRVMTGEDIARALKSFAEKYKSPLLMRTFEIFIGELATGGEIASILEKIVGNLRSTKEMREEMVASTISYTIFISLIVMFIAPTLFALSYQLISIISKVSRSVASTITHGTPVTGFFKISTTGVDVEAYKGFSILSIIIVALISSLIISVIQKGTIKDGLKYIPFFISISLLTYLLLLSLLGSIFGGLGL